MKSHLLTFLILISAFVSAQTFGPDHLVFKQVTTEVDEIFLQKSFNGWIYVGFNFYNYPYRGFRILRSTDDALSWQEIIGDSVPPGSGWYPQLNDMVVAGTDSTNLRVVFSLSGNGNAGPANHSALVTCDGINGARLNYYGVGDFTTYSVSGFSIATDARRPMSSSSPFSIAAFYSAADSLNMYYSNDGGLNYSHYNLLIDSVGAGDPHAAYGSYQDIPVGKFGVAFMHGNNVAVMFSDPGTPTSFSGPSLVDTSFNYASGKCRDIRLCMQSAYYFNQSADYTSIITARVNDTTGSSKAVAFYLNDTQNGGYWGMEIIDSSLNIKKTPSVSFHSADSTFLFTFYDSTANNLPLMTHNINFPGTWNLFSTEYPDTFRFLYPNPAVDGSDDVPCIWKVREDSAGMWYVPESIYYDQLASSVGIKDLEGTTSCMLFPNPAVTGSNIMFNRSLNNVSVSVINSLGRTILKLQQSEKSSSIKLPLLNAGIYTIVVKYLDRVTTLTLVQVR